MFLQVYSQGIYDTKYGLYIVTHQFIFAVFAYSVGKTQIKKNLSAVLKAELKLSKSISMPRKDY